MSRIQDSLSRTIAKWKLKLLLDIMFSVRALRAQILLFL